MGWSKSTRISIMLGIDIAFFFLELTTGFVVHSLALTADAFHMLNDIISLLVGLWAVIVARKATTEKYSYGWLRAEILGAFFNAVFLIALCVSIILEALTRFLDPPEIQSPQLIFVVGACGLVSNVVGFLVLGGHGHSHGHDDAEDEGEHGHDHGHEHAHSHSHSHSHGDALADAEEGFAAAPVQPSDPADEDGPVADLLPEVAVSRFTNRSPELTRHITFDARDDTRPDGTERGGRSMGQSRGRQRRRASSLRHSRLTSIEDLSIHPASFRQEIIAASRPQLEEDDEESASDGFPEDDEAEAAVLTEEPESYEETPLVAKNDSNGNQANGGYGAVTRTVSSRSRRGEPGLSLHHNHHHNTARKTTQSGGGHHGHSHSHSDMGMSAMVLHVIGDAIGNAGVMATALIIWFTTWQWRFYADPAISLVITAIILKSALPLTFATSKILLQATPDHISVKKIREDIERLPGVLSCHHVHIWQLSDTKIVASMHIQVAFPISEEGGEKYMALAREARWCLHACGIHSATIQPEFCLDAAHNHRQRQLAAEAAVGDAVTATEGGAAAAAAATAATGAEGQLDGMTALSARTLPPTGPDTCLLECVDNCSGKGCCPLQSRSSKSPSEHSSSSAHHHG